MGLIVSSFLILFKTLTDLQLWILIVNVNTLTIPNGSLIGPGKTHSEVSRYHSISKLNKQDRPGKGTLYYFLWHKMPY